MVKILIDILSLIISYYLTPFLFPPHKPVNTLKLFTSSELSSLSSSSKLFLAIGGEVFDVSAGKKFYGKGKGYGGFVGRDASRAFVTGSII